MSNAHKITDTVAAGKLALGLGVPVAELIEEARA